MPARNVVPARFTVWVLRTSASAICRLAIISWYVLSDAGKVVFAGTAKCVTVAPTGQADYYVTVALD